MAGTIFVCVAVLDWAVVGLLAGSSVVDGYVGSRIGQVLQAAVLRTGTIATVTMLG